jgi:HTH-type transcriptional regulator/antitoxin HigA
MTPGSDEEYLRLTAELAPRPIRTAEDASAVEARITELLAAATRSEAQTDYLDALSGQLVDWEEANEPIPDVAGVDLVRLLIDQQGLRQKDLVPIFGTESITSEVLGKRRDLQRKHIQALSKFFNVSPSAFFPAASGHAVDDRAASRRARRQATEGSENVRHDTSRATRLSIAFDAWAPAAVDYARTVMPMDITVTDPDQSASEKAKTAKRDNVILYTIRTATASILRLTEIGQVVLLASKDFSATTQTRLVERVSFFLLGQSQSAAGLPSHERIVLNRDHIDLVRFNTGSTIHADTIPLSMEPA